MDNLGWMSNQELFNHTGTLPVERIEALLELDEKREPISTAHIEEGMTQFPAEDFLSGVTERLNELAKRLRGENRETLNGIIEAIEDISQTTFYATEYGRSELGQAIAQINSWNEGVVK